MIDKIEKELLPLKKKLIKHELYNNLKTINDVKIFMEYHVFAVWDFMSLLKKLQTELTCTRIPWLPSNLPEAGRLINEIVWSEETDVNIDGEILSHFEMYLKSMRKINANTKVIERFTRNIKGGKTVHNALNAENIPIAVKSFIEFTFSIIEKDKLHETAAAFTFGREELLPELFLEFLKKLKKNNEKSIENTLYYFERHIELDGDEHGPMAIKLISKLCGKNQTKWEEALTTAKNALKMRIKLWDSINNEIKKNYSLVS